MSAASWFKKKQKSKDEQKKDILMNPSVPEPVQNGNGHGKGQLDHTNSNGESARTHKLAAEMDELEEALDNFGQEVPIVARSIPRGLHLERTTAARQQQNDERALRHCLYTPDVYDGMLKDSLDVCSLLQNNLDKYITQVRSNSPNELPQTQQHANGQSTNEAPLPVNVPAVPVPVPDTKKKSTWFAKNKKQTVATT